MSSSSRQREANQGYDRRRSVPEGGRDQEVFQQKETRVSVVIQKAAGNDKMILRR